MGVKQEKFPFAVPKDCSVALPVRQSSIKCFAECPRKYLYKVRLGLVFRGAYRDGATRGIVFHEMCNCLFSGDDPLFALRQSDLKLAALKERLKKDANEIGYLPNGKLADDVIAKAEKTYALGQAMALFVRQENPFKVYIPVVMEKEIRWEIDGVLCQATVDLILLNEKTGEYWIVDYKTTQLHPDSLLKVLRFGTQIRFYRQGVLESKLVPNVAGAIHVVLRAPSIRQKQTETFGEYVKRVATVYEEKQASARLGVAADRMLLIEKVRFSDHVDFDLQARARELAGANQRELKLSAYPRNESACLAWNTECEYLSLCSVTDRALAAVVDAKYEFEELKGVEECEQNESD